MAGAGPIFQGLGNASGVLQNLLPMFKGMGQKPGMSSNPSSMPGSAPSPSLGGFAQKLGLNKGMMQNAPQGMIGLNSMPDFKQTLSLDQQKPKSGLFSQF